MAKLPIADWEFRRADYFASLTRQVMTEGASGGEEVQPAVAPDQFGDPATVDPKIRAGAYAMFRALERGAPWENLPLQGSWTTPVGHRVAQWRIDPLGYVELRGAVTGGALASTIANLPVVARPQGLMTFLVGASGGSLSAQMTVNAAGDLVYSALSTGASAAFLSLAQVRWHPS